jgi:hypothetical protein
MHPQPQHLSDAVELLPQPGPRKRDSSCSFSILTAHLFSVPKTRIAHPLPSRSLSPSSLPPSEVLLWYLVCAARAWIPGVCLGVTCPSPLALVPPGSVTQNRQRIQSSSVGRSVVGRSLWLARSVGVFTLGGRNRNLQVPRPVPARTVCRPAPPEPCRNYPHKAPNFISPGWQ